MRSTLLASLLFSVSAATVAIPAAHAAPNEASSVLSACGTPSSDVYGTSEVSGSPLRTITYGKIRLNFEPASQAVNDGQWQFSTGWNGHIPETANELAKKLPCFGQGLSAAAQATATPTLAADPSIALQSQTAPSKRATFGIANLWLILFLFGVIAIFAVAIPRRRQMVSRPGLDQRPYRRPRLSMIRFRRRPAKTVVPSRP